MESGAIPRIRPVQLRIPALPLEQQERIVAYTRAVETLREQANLYGQQPGTLANAARYGACVGIV